MSGLYNPYDPPRASIDGPGSRASDEEVPPLILEYMRQTKPWVTFLSILGFIGSGLMVVGGLAFFAMTSTGPYSRNLPSGFFLFYIVIAGLYVFPSLHLSRYGASINRLLAGGGMDALAEALGHQKSFWRFVGMLAAAMMGLYALIFMGGLAFGLR